VHAAEPARRDLVVFAPTSLREAFGRLIPRFEERNAGVKVVLSTANSDELRHLVEHGAGADVIASSDWKQVELLAGRNRADPPTLFTCNLPVIVVRPDSPLAINGLADLPRASRLVVGIDETPVGRYARAVVKKGASVLGGDFQKRVDARIVSREKTAQRIVEKVVAGDADAGITYRNEALSAKNKVRMIPIEPEFSVVAEYTIAVVKDALHPDLAQSWIQLVQSPEGAAALRDTGFLRCPGK